MQSLLKILGVKIGFRKYKIAYY